MYAALSVEMSARLCPSGMVALPSVSGLQLGPSAACTKSPYLADHVRAVSGKEGMRTDGTVTSPRRAPVERRFPPQGCSSRSGRYPYLDTFFGRGVPLQSARVLDYFTGTVAAEQVVGGDHTERGAPA